MERQQRLRRRSDFQRVYGKGRSWASQALVIKALPRSDDLESSRFGYAVGKKLGNAVLRNRVKRRLRAAIAITTFPPGWDVIVIARPPAIGATWQELSATIGELRDRLVRHAARRSPEPVR